MNFPSAFKTRNFKNARERCIQHSRLDAKRHAVVTLGALLFAIGTSDLSAQVGDNNPRGNSGIFNGQINTGCSYDPYTGNATRSITDIAVAGAVGEYPLALYAPPTHERRARLRSLVSRADGTIIIIGLWKNQSTAKRKIFILPATPSNSQTVGWKPSGSQLGYLLSSESKQRRRGQRSGCA